MDLGQFQRRLTGRLLAWAAASIGLGLLWRRRGAFGRGLGEQFVGWGVINAVIALLGQRGAARQRAADPTAETEGQRHILARLLWVNTGLDVLYVLGGRRVAWGRGAEDDLWRGRGVGIMLQGGFLFVFDLLNALALRRLRLRPRA